MKNKYLELLNNSIFYAIGNGTKKVLMFLLIPIYTHVLTTYEYGISEIFTSALELMFPILTLAISDATFRFLLDKDSVKQKILTNSTFILLLGYAVIIIFLPVIAALFGWKNSILFLLLYISHSLLFLLSQYSRGIGKIKLFTTINIVNSIVLLISTIILLLIFKLGILGFLLPILFSNLFCIVWLSIKLKLTKCINLKLVDKKTISTMLSYSVFIVPNVIAWWGLNVANKYILIAFYSVEISGIFGAAAKLPSIINLFSSIFQQSWQYSSIVHYNKEGSIKFYENVFEFYNSMLTTTGALIIFILPWVTKLFLFGEFYNGWSFSAPLILAALIGSIAYYFGTFYQVVKKNSMGMVSTILGATIGLIFSFLLIVPFGPIGIAYSSVIGYIFIAVFRAVNTRKHIKLALNWRRTIYIFLILFLETVVWQFGVNSNTVLINFSLTILILIINRRTISIIVKKTFKYLRKILKINNKELLIKP